MVGRGGGIEEGDPGSERKIERKERVRGESGVRRRERRV